MHAPNKKNARLFFVSLLTIAILVSGCKPSVTSDQQAFEAPASPDELFGPLFEAVQQAKIFEDGKTFVDCRPLESPEKILEAFKTQRTKPGFNLSAFITEHFEMPAQPPTIIPEKDLAIRSGSMQAVKTHIEALWPLLQRSPDEAKPGSTLLPLPASYIVPGGRFREIYYWDSYFTMLGLKVSGRTDLIESMVKNFAFLIDTYGHIPNGNRSYYLSRSQPPFFSLMVTLLAEAKNKPALCQDYLQTIEKEYLYWMAGDKNLKPGETIQKVHFTSEKIFLNRYFDAASTPRPESYREDVLTAQDAIKTRAAQLNLTQPHQLDSFALRHQKRVYSHLRAAAESGWDFSSRWLTDPQRLSSIETTKLAPVDLNCLLFYTESLLGRLFHEKGDTLKGNAYQRWAHERQDAIMRYCYNKTLGFFTDYHMAQQKPANRITAAGLFPLCFLDTALLKPLIPALVTVVKQQLLAPGGLLTTPVESGQQWDAPNGWAPLQWMAIWGLERCGEAALAKTIASRWMHLNASVYARTGKMMEKYNVKHITLEAGGGEYPGQDGFGWTNGVFLALLSKYGTSIAKVE